MGKKAEPKHMHHTHTQSDAVDTDIILSSVLCVKFICISMNARRRI